MMFKLLAYSGLLAAFCLTKAVFSAPLASLTENTSGETKDALSIFFNRPLPTMWQLSGPCFQSCIQSGKTVSEVHMCSRQCLASAGTVTSHV